MDGEWTAYEVGDEEIADISVVSDGSCGNESVSGKILNVMTRQQVGA